MIESTNTIRNTLAEIMDIKSPNTTQVEDSAAISAANERARYVFDNHMSGSGAGLGINDDHATSLNWTHGSNPGEATAWSYFSQPSDPLNFDAQTHLNTGVWKNQWKASPPHKAIVTATGGFSGNDKLVIGTYIKRFGRGEYGILYVGISYK